MTNEYYSKWWITTKKQLQDLRAKDAILETKTKPMKNRTTANYFVGDLYTKYCMVLQNVAKCLDQSHMIQKNPTIKKLMDAGVIRLNELKEMFVYQLNFSEFYYLDNNLIEQKLIPHRIQILDPDFVCDRPPEVEDMWTAIKNGEKIYVSPPHTPLEIEVEEEEEEEEQVAAKPKFAPRFNAPAPVVLTPEEIAELEKREKFNQAVLLIQNHERGRQSRLYYYDLNTIKLMREQAVEGQPTPDAPIKVRIQAAITLQKHWRGRWARKLFKLREVERRILIGMDEPIWKTRKIFDDYDRGLEQQRQEKLQKLKEYIKLDTDEKTRLLRVVGPRIFEDITDEIRQWFYDFYQKVKGFDKYPEEIDGGSILIVREETPTPKEWLAQQKKLQLENAKGDAKAKAKKQKEKDKKILKQKLAKEKAIQRKEREQARQREAAGILLLKFEKSKAAELFEEGFKEYKTIWDPRPDHLNPLCKPYMDMITEQRCYEVQLEIRKEVDELMRLELEYLNAALAKDNKKKYKPPKQKKGKKKKKKKKSDDLTSHRTIEELFQELVDNGIIHTYPKVRLTDFKGDVSFTNFEKREMNLNPPPCLGDIRTAVMINCILPLGVNAMVKPKSVLIAGPPRSGKRVLANAIFNETRCVLFDITPRILVGKYSGNKGMNMLVHLINKMSRLLQPSIIYVDGAEKPFYKKIPQEEEDNEPRKMGGVLFKKIIKPIKPEDRVLVLGITSEPLKAKKKMENTFERIIFLSQPDYGSIYLYLRELLMSYRGIDRNFNVSELATMLKNVSLSYIKETLEKVLSTSRIAELEYKPFDSHEFLDALFDAPPPLTEKVWAKYEKWFDRTSLARRRNRLIAIQAENADKKKKK